MGTERGIQWSWGHHPRWMWERRRQLRQVLRVIRYTCKYVAQHPLDESVNVRTLTRNPNREGPFGDLVPAVPQDFADPEELRRSMEGDGRPLQHLLDSFWARADYL